MRRLVLKEPLSLSALWSRRIALFAVAVAAIGILLTRNERLDFQAVLGVMGSALAIALAALLMALLAFVRIWQEGFRGAGIATVGFVIAALLLGYPAYLLLQASRLPAIRDVSTDIVDPPAFSQSRDVLLARNGWIPPNSSAETRSAQRSGYPGLVPITLDRTAEEAFEIAREAAQNLGWQMIETFPPGRRSGIGRLDAIDRSLILRLPDDITVRVRPLANGSRIDIRSVSRYGWNDLGSNARRITRYAAAIDEIAKSR